MRHLRHLRHQFPQALESLQFASITQISEFRLSHCRFASLGSGTFERERAVKRGGGRAFISLGALNAVALKPMFLAKLMMPTAALLAVWAGSSLGIAVVGFTQEKPAAVPSTTPDSQRTTAILDQLETPVSMEFPNETPLGDVLKFINRATRKGPFDAVLPI